MKLIRKGFIGVLAAFMVSAVTPLLIPFALDGDGNLNGAGYAAGSGVCGRRDVLGRAYRRMRGVCAAVQEGKREDRNRRRKKKPSVGTLLFQ